MILRILLIALLLSGCRTIKKSFSSNDSSSVKTDQSSSKYNRETITEYLVDTIWRTRTQFDTLYRSVMVPDYKIVEKPYIIRQTIRESGENKTDVVEKVETKEVEKEKDAKLPALVQWSFALLAGSVLLIAITLLIKQFK